jgi:hypothetical protein
MKWSLERQGPASAKTSKAENLRAFARMQGDAELSAGVPELSFIRWRCEVSNVVEGFEEAVRARAYALWESEGRPNGRDAEHWLRSMEEVRRLAQAAPSDPPKPAEPKAPAKTKAKKVGKKH